MNRGQNDSCIKLRLVVFGITLPKIEFGIVIIFTSIIDDVTDFKAGGAVVNYSSRIFSSQYLSTHHFHEFLISSNLLGLIR